MTEFVIGSNLDNGTAPLIPNEDRLQQQREDDMAEPGLSQRKPSKGKGEADKSKPKTETGLFGQDDVSGHDDDDDDDDDCSGGGGGGGGEGEAPAVNVKDEARTLLSLVWPVALAALLQLASGLVLITFIGHYMDTLALDVVGMGISFGNVFGISIGHGLASASDTLSSQAWGSNRKKMLGVILQRGMCILGLAGLITSTLWINAEPILLLFHQDPQVAKLAGRFILYYLPALPLILLETLLTRYLQVCVCVCVCMRWCGDGCGREK